VHGSDKNDSKGNPQNAGQPSEGEAGGDGSDDGAGGGDGAEVLAEEVEGRVGTKSTPSSRNVAGVAEESSSWYWRAMKLP